MLACGREVQPPTSKHRNARQRRVGHRRDAIGDTGTGGRHADAELPRQFRVRVRHMDGGAFVADIDDADAELAAMVPDRLDVAAL